ncbi:MAG: hypothetical protein WB952_17620 [Terriglobales bacterium]
MKKTGLLLILCLAIAASAQQPAPADQAAPNGTLATNVNFPIERIETPTRSDLYCAGFVNKEVLPNASFVAGGLDTPTTTQYADGDVVYLAGRNYEVGKQYTIVRELHDPNRYENFAGQFAMLKSMGQPYAELATVRVLDARGKMAIAHIDFSCQPLLPGDIVIPFTEKPSISFHPPLRFDRFVPANGKLSGRIVAARDFDAELGSGMKVYLNLGSNQGVKAGDYFRAVRAYEADLHNAVDSLSFKASTAEDTQAKPPSIDQTMLTKNKGPEIHVADFPRRAVGEVVILTTTPTTATGMIVFAMEDIHLGDGVELDPQ